MKLLKYLGMMNRTYLLSCKYLPSLMGELRKLPSKQLSMGKIRDFRAPQHQTSETTMFTLSYLGIKPPPEDIIKITLVW